MSAQEKKRRFDAQQLGILQKSEKMPKKEFDGLLLSSPELPEFALITFKP